MVCFQMQSWENIWKVIFKMKLIRVILYHVGMLFLGMAIFFFAVAEGKRPWFSFGVRLIKFTSNKSWVVMNMNVRLSDLLFFYNFLFQSDS